MHAIRFHRGMERPSGRSFGFGDNPPITDCCHSVPSLQGDAMTTPTVCRTYRIRDLNDAFRRTFVGGAVMITAGVEAMPLDRRHSLLQKIRAFETFNGDNDPNGEHDFGSIDEGGVRCFWKIDCYDRAIELGSPDPTDPAVTTRVLTIMLAEEY